MSFPAIQQQIICNQNDMPLVTIQVWYNGSVLPITEASGYVPTVYLKASQTGSILDTYTVGSGLTLVNSGDFGQYSWLIPSGVTGTPGTFWWHAVIEDQYDNLLTHCYGNLYVVAC